MASFSPQLWGSQGVKGLPGHCRGQARMSLPSLKAPGLGHPGRMQAALQMPSGPRLDRPWGWGWPRFNPAGPIPSHPTCAPPTPASPTGTDHPRQVLTLLLAGRRPKAQGRKRNLHHPWLRDGR